MFEFTFWKVSLEGRAFIFVGVPLIAVAAVVVITGGVVAVVMAVVMAVAVVMAPGKGFGENFKKSSPRREGGFPLGLLMREGVQVGVIGIPFNTLPA